MSIVGWICTKNSMLRSLLDDRKWIAELVKEGSLWLQVYMSLSCLDETSVFSTPGPSSTHQKINTEGCIPNRSLKYVSSWCTCICAIYFRSENLSENVSTGDVHCISWVWVSAHPCTPGQYHHHFIVRCGAIDRIGKSCIYCWKPPLLSIEMCNSSSRTLLNTLST